MIERRLESLINAKTNKDTIIMLNNIEDIDDFLVNLDNLITVRTGELPMTNLNYKFSEHAILDDYIRTQRMSAFNFNPTQIVSTGLYSSELSMSSSGITFTVKHGYKNDLKKFIELCMENNPDIEFFKKVLMVLTI